MAFARLLVPARAASRRDAEGPTSLLVRLARLKKPTPAASAPETPQDSLPDASGSASAPEPLGGFKGTLERVFGLDVRSLALFRICLALIMIGDLLYRAQDLQAHYTDAGVFPIALVSIYQQQHWWWTIHTLHPALAPQVVLFLIAGLFSFSLLIGYRTRTVSIICWLLLVSLQNRNVLVLTGGDGMLRMMAFWAMFLPLGTRWSVDRALDKTNAPMPQRIYSVGSAALVTQFAVIYLFGALLKTGPTWRVNHLAIYYALSLGQFATPLAKALLHYPELLKTLTFLAWNLEFLAPFLILASAFSGPLRTVVVLAYMGFHVSLGLCLELGLFPTIGALSWLVLMPAWFWTKLFQLWSRLPSRLQPTFDAALKARLTVWSAWLRPQSVSTHTPRAVQALAGFFLLYMLCWNVRMTNFPRYTPFFPISWNWIGEVVRIDQSWALFAPNPTDTQAWIVVPATLQNDAQVDLKTQLPPTDAEPPLISATYYNERWRKYLMNISDGPDQNQCFAYASYLGNRWNNTHPAGQHVQSLDIYVIRNLILPNGRYAPPKKELLFHGDYHATP